MPFRKREVSNVEETDDIKLLKECDAGVQMAISSIDEVLEKISDDQLKDY